MKFIKTLVAFFRAHGIADPIAHLAAAGGVGPDSIWLYCRQADHGIGRGERLLDPKVAAWLVYESERTLAALESNPVREFLEPRLAAFRKARGKETT